MWLSLYFSTILSNASTGLGAGIFGSNSNNVPPKNQETLPPKNENQAPEVTKDEKELLIRLFHNGKSLVDTSDKDRKTMRTLIAEDIIYLQNQTGLRIDDYVKNYRKKYKIEDADTKHHLTNIKPVIENFLDTNNSQSSNSIDIFSIKSRDFVLLYKDYLETELNKTKEPKKTSSTPPPPQIKTQTINAGGPRARPSGRRSGDTLVRPPLFNHHFTKLTPEEASRTALTGRDLKKLTLEIMGGTTPTDTTYDRQMEFKKLKDLGEFAADLKMEIDKLNNKIQNQHIAKHNRKDYTAQVRILQSNFNKIFEAYPGGNRSKEEWERSVIDDAFRKRLKEAKPTARVQIKGAGSLVGKDLSR